MLLQFSCSLNLLAMSSFAVTTKLRSTCYIGAFITQLQQPILVVFPPYLFLNVEWNPSLYDAMIVFSSFGFSSLEQKYFLSVQLSNTCDVVVNLWILYQFQQHFLSLVRIEANCVFSFNLVGWLGRVNCRWKTAKGIFVGDWASNHIPYVSISVSPQTEKTLASWSFSFAWYSLFSNLKCYFTR